MRPSCNILSNHDKSNVCMETSPKSACRSVFYRLRAISNPKQPVSGQGWGNNMVGRHAHCVGHSGSVVSMCQHSSSVPDCTLSAWSGRVWRLPRYTICLRPSPISPQGSPIPCHSVMTLMVALCCFPETAMLLCRNVVSFIAIP